MLHKNESPTSFHVRGGIVAAGCVLYLPPGCVVAEKALRNNFVFGIRRTCLAKDAGHALNSFLRLKGMMPSCDTKSHAADLLAPPVAPAGGLETPGGGEEAVAGDRAAPAAAVASSNSGPSGDEEQNKD